MDRDICHAWDERVTARYFIAFNRFLKTLDRFGLDVYEHIDTTKIGNVLDFCEKYGLSDGLDVVSMDDLKLMAKLNDK